MVILCRCCGRDITEGMIEQPSWPLRRRRRCSTLAEMSGPSQLPNTSSLVGVSAAASSISSSLKRPGTTNRVFTPGPDHRQTASWKSGGRLDSFNSLRVDDLHLRTRNDLRCHHLPSGR